MKIEIEVNKVTLESVEIIRKLEANQKKTNLEPGEWSSLENEISQYKEYIFLDIGILGYVEVKNTDWYKNLK